MMKFYRQHSAEHTYPSTQYSNVTTHFTLMMEPLQLYVPDLSTET